MLFRLFMTADVHADALVFYFWSLTHHLYTWDGWRRIFGFNLDGGSGEFGISFAFDEFRLREVIFFVKRASFLKIGSDHSRFTVKDLGLDYALTPRNLI